MDRISDGIEWRSEQQELFLWLFHSRLAHEVALVFTARRPGDGEDFVSHGAWMLMANWQRKARPRARPPTPHAARRSAPPPPPSPLATSQQ